MQVRVSVFGVRVQVSGSGLDLGFVFRVASSDFGVRILLSGSGLGVGSSSFGIRGDPDGCRVSGEGFQV